MGRNVGYSSDFTGRLDHTPDGFRSNAISPYISVFLDATKNLSLGDSLAVIHSSIAAFTQFGMGTVRRRFPFPRRSPNNQWFYRTPRSMAVSSTTSPRRRPQPRRIQIMARSRFPRSVSWQEWARSTCACSMVSQLPTRTSKALRTFDSSNTRCQLRTEYSVVGCFVS